MFRGLWGCFRVGSEDAWLRIQDPGCRIKTSGASWLGFRALLKIDSARFFVQS